jgi:hypothetical protein
MTHYSPKVAYRIQTPYAFMTLLKWGSNLASFLRLISILSLSQQNIELKSAYYRTKYIL